MSKKPTILLLPPGGFDCSYFEYYLKGDINALRKYSVICINLPSRKKLSKKPMRDDGRYIANYINQSTQKFIVIGTSTSAASLLESLPLIENNKISSVCIIFGGEIIPRKWKSVAKMALFLLNSNPISRSLFSTYLKMKSEPYKRDKSIQFKRLLQFYTKAIDWNIPSKKIYTPALIIHALNDDIVDGQSIAKLESIFPNSKILKPNILHEPTDSTAKKIFDILLSEESYLQGKIV